MRFNNQLAALMDFIGSGDRRPPPQAYEVFSALSPKLNALLKAAGLAPIVPTTNEGPAKPVVAM